LFVLTRIQALTIQELFLMAMEAQQVHFGKQAQIKFLLHALIVQQQFLL